jgi:hypothetical protein
MSVCIFKQFHDIFGLPNTGVHATRFLDTALVDYALTIIIAIVTTYFTKIPLVLTTIGWFIIGLICHIIFGVETNTVKLFGINC